jgi:hypothetical protein
MEATRMIGDPNFGNSRNASDTAPKNVPRKTTRMAVFKNQRPEVEKGRSFRIVARIRIIRHRISTTSWVMATSGAFKTRNVIEMPKPTALTETTEESKSFSSTATSAPMIMKTSNV